METSLSDVSIGEICNIQAGIESNEIVARAQVVGFHDEKNNIKLDWKFSWTFTANVD